MLCTLCIGVFLPPAPASCSIYPRRKTYNDRQHILTQLFVLALLFRFFQNFYPVTHAIEKSLNGSEPKAGHSIPMFNDNLFDFTLASRVSDREELAAIVVSTRGNLGTV
jgi:hypothetical protein